MIREVTRDKKAFLPLLLVGDEQESMIDRYLDAGRLFVLEEGAAIALCVVSPLAAPGEYELNNLAVQPAHQRRGCGRTLIEFLFCALPDCRTLYASTGDSPLTLPFYRACGFVPVGRVEGYFLVHYDHPIFEGGRRVTDLVRLKKERPRSAQSR